ncbi:MAG: Si-specific NAD(P)(+) transhydrogenase [Actinomycetota bacterium]|nr:Si-specific NAD(P)(+) transhydrogenase [Actinomycetota bacterium]
MSDDFDLVVLGAGPAGEKGAAQAAYFGKRVAIVEREPMPGGAAVHTGTLPSKTLRETALFLSGYRQRDLYGVTVDIEPHLAVGRLIARKNAVRELETARIVRNLDRHGIEQVRGDACFVDAHTVEVAGRSERRRLSTQVALIATGSSPFRPAGIPHDDPDVHDSDAFLGIDHLPDSLTVLGGGVIGCEYASVFAALGVDVHLVDPRPRLLPFLDLEMGERLREAMLAHGITFHLNERAERVERLPGRGVVVRLTSGTELAADKLLVAAGRKGNTASLGLETIGAKVDERGYVVVDTHFRSTVPSVLAAGDVIGFPALASVSMEQARVAVCQAFGFAYKQRVSSLLPFGVYTIPEVSCVGLSEQDAAREGIGVIVGRAFFRDNARGQIVGDRDGMVKLIFDRATRALVGCHCIGERASELVHVGQAVIALGGTVETLIEMVFNFPTLSEAYKYAAYDALATFDPGPVPG